MSLKQLKLTKSPHNQYNERYEHTWVADVDCSPVCKVCGATITAEHCWVVEICNTGLFFFNCQDCFYVGKDMEGKATCELPLLWHNDITTLKKSYFVRINIIEP